MHTRWNPPPAAVLAALLLAIGAATVGCEETPLLAPSDGHLTLVATPSVAAAQTAFAPADEVHFSTITAQLLSMQALPLSGRTVTFSPGAGTLTFTCSGGHCTLSLATPVDKDTDNVGVARVVLAVTNTDPASVVVTGQSGTLTQTVTVTNPLGPNEPPTAAISAVPASPANASSGPVAVLFSSTSTDPNNDPLTCYEWVLTSSFSGPEPPRYNVTSVSRNYADEQIVTVRLRVSDEPGLVNATCNGTAPFSENAAQIIYVVCTNTPPTAVISPAGPLNGNLSGTHAFTFDGSASDDAETVVTYDWDCDNGAAHAFSPDPMATCTYTTTGTFSVTLTVKDKGNGRPDECSRTATATPVTVTIAK